MKQHHLSTKFLRFYILIGILGFFLITLGGSYMLEKHLEHSLSAALYTEAHNIASNEADKSNISSSTVDTLQEHLCAISDFQDAVLWIINSNGEIIVSTQKNIDVRDPIPLEEFDASALIKVCHRIMDCHVTFGFHIRGDRGNNTQMICFKETIKLSNLIIVASPFGSIEFFCSD